MNVELEPGKYVVAVSGGVDSIVLLHLLQHQPHLELVVAHFDHGIRPDSGFDREFVEQVAKAHGLKFVSVKGKLGVSASEATARTARYKFLHGAMEQNEAKAIITAHHQDDLIETALINLVRGTNRKGISSLNDTPAIKRPLLGISKKEIKQYAGEHGLIWREDSTNQDQKYLRNKIRAHLSKNMTDNQRQDFVKLIAKMQKLNLDIDDQIAKNSQFIGKKKLNRQEFINLPHEVAKEILAFWLRQNSASFDTKNLERLVANIKTLPAGKQLDVDLKHFIKLTKTDIILSAR